MWVFADHHHGIDRSSLEELAKLAYMQEPKFIGLLTVLPVLALVAYPMFVFFWPSTLNLYLKYVPLQSHFLGIAMVMTMGFIAIQIPEPLDSSRRKFQEQYDSASWHYAHQTAMVSLVTQCTESLTKLVHLFPPFAFAW